MPKDTDRDDVQRLLAAGAHLIDVLPAEEYEAEHIAGALSIPLKTLGRQTTARLGRNRPVVVYCWDAQ